MMKQIFIITLLILGMKINAQKKLEFIPVLTYEDCNNPDKFVKMNKRGKAGEYHTKDNAIIKLRDTIILKEAFANIGKDAGYYTNIVEGNPNDGGRIALQVLGALASSKSNLGDVNRLREKPGEPVTIEIIRFVRSTKKRPAKIEMLLRPIYGASNWSATYYITDVEEAIKHEEFYHTSMLVSEDDLLAALKKSKEKLDMELITREEYNIIKEEIVKKLQKLE